MVSRSLAAALCVSLLPAPLIGSAVAQDIPRFDVKYEQPLDCDASCGFSNLNSTFSPFTRYDDFVCNATGDVHQVVFWGGGWDLFQASRCQVRSKIAAIEVSFYERDAGGVCGWQPGDLISTNTISIDDIDLTYACTGASGIDYFRYELSLPDPFYQQVGTHYALRIAAILEDPDDPCVFCWAGTDGIVGDAALSERPDGSHICSSLDQAFELVTRRRDQIKYTQHLRCASNHFLSNLDSTLNPFLRYDDFVCTATGHITDIVFWGGGWDLNDEVSCALDNIESIEVSIYEWEDGGPCDWNPGDLLYRETYGLAALDPQFECAPRSEVEHFRFHAELGTPFFQEAGHHYALRIAANLAVDFDPCVFGWSQCFGRYACDAYSQNRFGGCSSSGFDNAFELYTDSFDLIKYEQRIDCDFKGFLSNDHSRASPLIHYDDFVCNQTGHIIEIDFWGAGWDIRGNWPCDLSSNVPALEVKIFEWVDGGPCGWQTGRQLWNEVHDLKDLSPSSVCSGPRGEDFQRFTLKAEEPFFQTYGTRYAISVMGLPIDDEGPCLFTWARTFEITGEASYSEDRFTGICTSASNDPAYALITEPCRVEFEEYGTGLAGSGGFVPHLVGFDGACRSQGYSIVIDQGLGLAQGFLWIDSAPASIPWLGGTLLVDPGPPNILYPIWLAGPAGAPGEGFTNFSGTDLSSYVGTNIYMQAIIMDPAAPNGASLTNGLEMKIR